MADNGMISVEEARARILSFFRRLPAERKPLLQALGQVVAEDIIAPFDIPPLDNSGMDGYALAMRIREDLAEQAPALVALTGYGQPTDRARSLEVGFDVHLVKPPDHRALLGLVQRLADERRRPKGPPPPSEPLRRGGEARDDA